MLNTKEQLHKKIDLINDDVQLSILNETAEQYLVSNETTFNLTQEQIKAIEQSIEQARNGDTITNEEMNEKLRKWFTK